MPTEHSLRLYAHRGASRIRPENTLVAFRQALDDGADALELDVHLTRDGGLVVSHDPTGERIGVKKAIADATLAEVRDWDAGAGFVDAFGERPYAGQGIRIPTFEEVLGEFPGVPLNVDVKQDVPAVADRLLEVLRASNALERVIVASFHDRILAHVRTRVSEARTSLGPKDVLWLAYAPGFVRPWRKSSGHAAQVPPRTGPTRLDHADFVARAHAAGHRVDYWVINDPRQARLLLSIGADGIMSDDPASVRDEVRAAALRRKFP